MEEEYGRQEWQTDEAAAMAEARRRIAVMIEDGGDTLDFADLHAMCALPEEIQHTTGLRKLYAGVHSPSHGDLGFRGKLEDISSLSVLQNLNVLDVSYTNVIDLSALSGLTALSSLDVSSTGVIDLSTLSGLSALSSLDVSGTGVTDLSALSGLAALSSLDVSDTGVIDLSVLLNIPMFEAENGAYLRYDATPAADAKNDRRLDLLSRLDPQRCAIETIQYLKGTHPDFRDPPKGAVARPVVGQLAAHSPVDFDVVGGDLTPVNPSPPERLAPKELGQRLHALRNHVAAMIEECAQCQIPAQILSRFERYATPLNTDEPTYLLLDAPVKVLEGALNDPYVTEPLDKGFVAGWRHLLEMHDELRPLLLPPKEDDELPNVDPKVTPDDGMALTDELVVAFDAPGVSEAVKDTLYAAKEYFEAATANIDAKPGLMKKGFKAIGGIAAAIVAAVGATVGVTDVSTWALSPQGQAVIEAVRPILEKIVRVFTGG